MSLNNFFYDKQTDVMFSKNSKSQYVPIAVDYNPETSECRFIDEDPMLTEIMEYCSFVQTKKDNRGRYITQELFPYQYGALFNVCEAIVRGDNESFLIAISRQAGKSHLIRFIVAICLTILPKYMEITNERFSIVLGSYDKDAVEALFLPCKAYVYKAIEFQNKRNKDKLLGKTGENSSKKVVDSKEKLEINKLFASDGDEIPYSMCTAITLGTVNDGLYSHINLVDEGGLNSYDKYTDSCAPFLSSTSGIDAIFGVPKVDVSSLLHRKYESPVTKNLIYTVKDVYRMKKMVSEKEAIKYINDYNNKEKEHGLNSTFIQSNYYVSFDSANGKFCSRELLSKNNMMTETERYPKVYKNDRNRFVCASLDISSKHDYKPMIIGESEKRDADYINTVTYMETFNKLGKRQSFETMAEDVIKNFIKYKVDIFCFDATNQGGHAFSQQLHKYKKIYKCNTMIIMYSYNQSTKTKLFSFLEENMYNCNIKLLLEEESWESKKLIEEMLYMIKEMPKKGGLNIKYYAPEGSSFTDDHVNSLALFNIALKMAFEKRGVRQDDGENRWRVSPVKFRDNGKYVKKENNDLPTHWCVIP